MLLRPSSILRKSRKFVQSIGLLWELQICQSKRQHSCCGHYFLYSCDNFYRLRAPGKLQGVIQCRSNESAIFCTCTVSMPWFSQRFGIHNDVEIQRMAVICGIRFLFLVTFVRIFFRCVWVCNASCCKISGNDLQTSLVTSLVTIFAGSCSWEG